MLNLKTMNLMPSFLCVILSNVPYLGTPFSDRTPGQSKFAISDPGFVIIFRPAAGRHFQNVLGALAYSHQRLPIPSCMTQGS